MIGSHHGDEFFGKQLLPSQVFARGGQKADAQIQSAGFDVGFNVGHGQLLARDMDAR